MVGRYRILIKAKTYQFDITVERKFTVLMGDSGTGKTVFVDMVENQRYYSMSCSSIWGSS